MLRFNRTLLLGIAATTFAAGALAGEATSPIADKAGEAKLTTEVKTALLADSDVKGMQINVESHDDRVQLNGFVDTPVARAEAEKIAAGIAGPKNVSNNLHVRSSERSAGEAVDDATLATRVKVALGADERTAAYRVDVSTYKGVVSLGGFVPSEAERDAAVAVAQGVEQVVAVHNGIEVMGL